MSLQEWFALLEGLQLGLHGSGLTGFYHLARATLVKTESDFDKFDIAFLEFFKGIKTYEEIPQEIMDWLSTPIAPLEIDEETMARLSKLDLDELRRQFEERMKEQDEKHDGGGYWIGTGGTSPFGHSGYHPGGIRIGGPGRNRSAMQVAGARNYADFREDKVLEERQFQMAFRSLRQFSSNELGPKDELKLVFGRPRRNNVKVVVLFDSGGSMTEYARLCSSLFQAASKSNHFGDLKTYFFHNCFYERLYTTPQCMAMDSVETDWVLQNLKSDYRVIVVGDASMAPSELLRVGGSLDYYHYNQETGIDWIRRFRKKYEKMIWLNPIEPEYWDWGYGSATIRILKEEVPMYHLSVGGLQAGLKSLVAAR